MDRVIRVLVVDDSAYVRKVVKQMLARSPFIEVVGTAHDGAEALELTAQLQPDVVTLDLIMPVMDGITYLRTQMARRPVPVLVVSIASESGEAALTALDAGAVELLLPGQPDSQGVEVLGLGAKHLYASLERFVQGRGGLQRSQPQGESHTARQAAQQEGDGSIP